MYYSYDDSEVNSHKLKILILKINVVEKVLANFIARKTLPQGLQQ